MYVHAVYYIFKLILTVSESFLNNLRLSVATSMSHLLMGPTNCTYRQFAYITMPYNYFLLHVLALCALSSGRKHTSNAGNVHLM